MIFRLIDSVIKIISPSPRRSRAYRRWRGGDIADRQRPIGAARLRDFVRRLDALSLN
jgi:hypothetical protein